MSGMFRCASSFNQPLNSWDMSGVTDVSEMFAEAESFNQPLGAWKLSGLDSNSPDGVRDFLKDAKSFSQPEEEIPEICRT